jgi:hypothetical protein
VLCFVHQVQLIRRRKVASMSRAQQVMQHLKPPRLLRLRRTPHTELPEVQLRRPRAPLPVLLTSPRKVRLMSRTQQVTRHPRLPRLLAVQRRRQRERPQAQLTRPRKVPSMPRAQPVMQHQRPRTPHTELLRVHLARRRRVQITSRTPQAMPRHLLCP